STAGDPTCAHGSCWCSHWSSPAPRAPGPACAANWRVDSSCAGPLPTKPAVLLECGCCAADGDQGHGSDDPAPVAAAIPPAQRDGVPDLAAPKTQDAAYPRPEHRGRAHAGHTDSGSPAPV